MSPIYNQLMDGIRQYHIRSYYRGDDEIIVTNFKWVVIHGVKSGDHPWCKKW